MGESEKVRRLIVVESDTGNIQKGIEKRILRLSVPDFDKFKPQHSTVVLFKSGNTFAGLFKVSGSPRKISLKSGDFVHSKSGKFYTAYECDLTLLGLSEPFWFSPVFSYFEEGVYVGSSAEFIVDLSLSYRVKRFMPSFVSVDLKEDVLCFTSVVLSGSLKVRRFEMSIADLENLVNLQVKLLKNSPEKAGEVVYENFVSKLFDEGPRGMMVVLGDWYKIARFPFVELARDDEFLFRGVPMWFLRDGRDKPSGEVITLIADGSDDRFVDECISGFDLFEKEGLKVQLVVSPHSDEIFEVFEESMLVHYAGHGENGWSIDGKFEFESLKFLGRVPAVVISDSCGNDDYISFAEELVKAGVKAVLVPVMRVEQELGEVAFEIEKMLVMGEGFDVVSAFFSRRYPMWWKFRWFGSSSGLNLVSSL